MQSLHLFEYRVLQSLDLIRVSSVAISPSDLRIQYCNLSVQIKDSSAREAADQDLFINRIYGPNFLKLPIPEPTPDKSRFRNLDSNPNKYLNVPPKELCYAEKL